MLTDPLILFCDEPTTGLDSASTGVVVKLLKKFSSEGKIVICSIHQPTAAVFELFDTVLLLASGGRAAYFGPVSNAVNYFARSIYDYVIANNRRTINLICDFSHRQIEFEMPTFVQHCGIFNKQGFPFE